MPKNKTEFKATLLCPFNIGYSKKSYTAMEVINTVTLERAPVTRELIQQNWQLCSGYSCPYYDIESHKCTRVETERSNSNNDIINTISKINTN